MKLRGLELVGSWPAAELAELEKIVADLPPAWVEGNPNFRFLVRRPVLENAPASAPGHSKYEPALGAIVVFDKGVYDDDRIDPEQFRRSIFHELAHSLVRSDAQLLVAWTAARGNGGFVDEYAKTSPEEDFADTFSEYLIDPVATRKAVPPKAEFIRGMLERSSAQQEKVAMNFMRGFANEIVKTAAPGAGRLAKMMRFGRQAKPDLKPASRGIGKMLALGGGAAVGGAALGARKGKEKGYDEGTSDVMDVAQKARMLGRKEGVMAYHQALQERLRSSSPE
ncbi:MAG: hypothetical protein KBF21_07650 [Thermoanaerobaculia bacterium]|nr:hypothetical protein [Thermoanaerobaculia bacterium]